MSISRLDPHELAQHVILRYGWNTTAFQILNPGITLWFSPDEEAVVGYVTKSNVRVVAGAPICAFERLAEVVAIFEHQAQQDRQQVCYFCVQQDLVPFLNGCGTKAQLLLGAQPIWNPQHWVTIVQTKASIRAQLSRVKNKGVTTHSWSSQQATHHPQLAQCLHEWLQTRALPPMRFLVEPNMLGHLDYRRVYVAKRSNHIVGFLIASPIPMRNGWHIEHIIRCKDAPNGTSELLIDCMMQDVAADGATYVTLGLSPLSQRATIPPISIQQTWLRLLLAWVRHHGQRFYNFDGLDSFKAKMNPEQWEPIYAITTERTITPRTMYAIAGAFSGISPMVFLARGIARAVGQEFQWFRGR